MIQGKYNIKMKTPIGDKIGSISFEEKPDKLIGVLELMGNSNSFEGKTNGNNFSFSGETITPIGKVRICTRRKHRGRNIKCCIKNQSRGYDDNRSKSIKNIKFN